MADAEFTHEGDRCSFETLVFLTGLETDPALRALGEIVHDLDIADARFERPETPGVSALIAGKIGRAHVCTPVTNAHLVCRLLLEQKKNYIHKLKQNNIIL